MYLYIDFNVFIYQDLESEIKNQAETAAMLKTQQSKLFRYGELERQISLLTQENSKLR